MQKRSVRHERSSSQPTPRCRLVTSSTSTGHVSSWSSSSAMPSSSPGSHTVRRETKKLCRLPSTPRSHPSSSPGHPPVSKGWPSRSVQPKHCCTTLQWSIDLLQCPENLRTCDEITLISKNLYSTAFAPWRNFYKINELLF